MALLDHLTPPAPRPLPRCTSCGNPFSFDRAIRVVELAYFEAGNCPDCCDTLVESDRADNTSEARALPVGGRVRVDETVTVVLPRIQDVDWAGYHGRPVPVRPRQTGPDSFMVEIDPREPDDLRLWVKPSDVRLMPTDVPGEWTLTCSLLVCRDQPAANPEATVPWSTHLGDRKYAELRFASESERAQVAMEALNLGFRVQFTSLAAFEHTSGVAHIKQLCASYYGDSDADNPTSQMEYETGVAGDIISALEEAYQFES